MAFRLAMLKRARDYTCHSHVRWAHTVARPPPFSASIGDSSAVFPSPEMIGGGGESRVGFQLPSFSFFGGGAMELMAVPKRKTSPHKRGIRNGPKALKPVPVIVRCTACGRVKLQHFFCCSGFKQHLDEHNK